MFLKITYFFISQYIHLNFCSNYLIKNIIDNKNINITITDFKFSKNYGYCEKNYCFGIPFIIIGKNNFLLCSQKYKDKLENERISRKTCSLLNFDGFLGLTFHFRKTKFVFFFLFRE